MVTFDAIFLIGPQGSGKGTQGKRLAAKTGYFYFEMGAILRQEAKLDSDFGRVVKSYIDRGELLDDANWQTVIHRELPEVLKHRRIIFDGTPRTLAQAEHLVSALHQEGFTQLATIVVDIPRDVAVARLLERAHHEFRTDDNEVAIKRRLEIYDQATIPVIHFMRGVSTVFDIDGVPPINEVEQVINQELGL
jgi:adenylate kinase